MKRFLAVLIIVISVLQAQIPEKIKSEEKSIPLGVAMSTILPGAGQWYNGNKGMAALYVALEAIFISSTVYFNHQGDLEVDNYEDYADLHWHVQDWLTVYDPAVDPTTHRSIVYIDNRSYSPEEQADYDAMMADIADGYFNMSIVKDYHFYENIGKYVQFKQGWDDWYPGSEDDALPEYGIYAKFSENQYTYAAMRRYANQLLDFGTYFGTAIFLNHFMSAIDAGFRIKKGNENREIMLTLHTEPLVRSTGAVGLQTGIAVTF